ncbi:hypothetical protein PPL_03124 [Heterostelium album PN500]|uniref:THH1/TOM1/TOM3 domain-containing protein n=1 Tax=Heterostelium pallidum (strain ATCC 26659 / Pp 5 / PN500) TaxID=670386 RepID=D3B403_HETP5|nr:hypothetical protein PPL_03124 [Heterostelium album PN500]EFA84051.1 hypothetical protein PPL_03124 [Heterostelium album PN500]|eukprot:XP_020436168.1 hypothetical protein PPL_03124 [Heterostelium album PN500]
MLPLNCSIDNICGKHGICKDGICECIAYWDGNYCETPFKDELGNVFLFWRFRILYLSLDPMVQTYLIPPTITQLLGGLSLYFVFTAYLLVLLHWISVYHHVFSTRCHKILIPATKRVFIVVNTIWLLAELTARILYGLEQSNILKLDSGLELIDLLYGIYIVVVGFVFSFFFMVYGSLIFVRIRDAQFEKKTKEKVFTKLTFIVTILSWTFLVATISVILIVVFNGQKTPFGAIFSMSAQFIFEIVLIIEMFYILKRQEMK